MLAIHSRPLAFHYIEARATSQPYPACAARDRISAIRAHIFIPLMVEYVKLPGKDHPMRRGPFQFSIRFLSNTQYRRVFPILILVGILSGCGSSALKDPTSQSAPKIGAHIENETQRMKWVVANGSASVARGMAPDEVLSILGEPSIRDTSDYEKIGGRTEALSCWLYDHPDNPTQQDRALQVCFRVHPTRGGRLYWAKVRTGEGQ